MSLFQANIQSIIYESFAKQDSMCCSYYANEINNAVSNKSSCVKPQDADLLHKYTEESLKQYKPKIILCGSDEAYLCYQALSFILHQKNTKDELLPILLPDICAKPFDSMQSFYSEFRELFAKLSLWYRNDCKQILVSPVQTLMAFMPSANLLSCFNLSLGENIANANYLNQSRDDNIPSNFKSSYNIEDRTNNLGLKKLVEKLLHYGYEHVEIVEMQGEFSHRGDIIDIFIPNTNMPVRLSFFDTEIESIRYFDYQTQLSNREELERITIYPALFSLSDTDYLFLESKIKSVDNTNDSYQYAIEKSINTVGFWFLKDIGGINLLKHYASIFTPKAIIEYKENLEYIDQDLLLSDTTKIKVLKNAKFFKDMDTFRLSNLANTIRLNANKQIMILSPINALIKSLLDDNQTQYIESTKNIKNIITPFYLHIQSETQMFISLQKPQRIQKKTIRLDLDSLKVGDFVVHNEYGVGIFQAIQQVSIMGGLKDFISIIYANDDKLLLPVENLNMIEKYTSFDNTIIKLDKLGKSNFLRLKDSIKERLLEIANEIIRVQAQRELSNGSIISLQSPQNLIAYSKFEEARGFELTKDQEVAIHESFKDLASGKVMDRLLNGDVGFGKTEVAMSICFVSAINGYTSFVLVPTTLLCNQHFDSFKERMKKIILPNGKMIGIAKIDRFTTQKQKEILQKDLANGNIHIVVGTHALFNLEAKNLGLIVIDEEHKFGVKQKETLKQKSINTHVLSMSATPIPRTLNMAYSKLKAISHLQTPPTYKQENKTFVKQKQDSLIKEVIIRELRRGGQVFYIYNNIARMPNIKKYLLDLLPNLKILVLHSKVSPKDTEKGMLDFLHNEYNVLLCTSIVESGIHLPNANTIIIDNAENFGIADLHQLRGRVGRGKAVGFCYFLVNENLNNDAKQRFLALEKNSYLGSGANLAMRDLEIRGGGNLLGQAQSGHIKQVGFGMYVRMLEETLHSLLQSSTHDNKVDLKLSISAFLDSSLITSERMRLELYRRLSQVKSEYEVYEIEHEIEERFGKLDKYSSQFLELIIIKTLASKLQIKSISNMAHNISLIYHDNSRITLNSPTKDDDDIILTIKEYLKKMLKNKPNENQIQNRTKYNKIEES